LCHPLGHLNFQGERFEIQPHDFVLADFVVYDEDATLSHAALSFPRGQKSDKDMAGVRGAIGVP
jgi:hypothetical protein